LLLVVGKFFIAMLLLSAFSSSALAKVGGGPTPGQVRAAVKRAEHSRQLWATINICNTQAYPDRIGIRGQMPALGFPARLTMTIQVDYWVAAAKGFKPVPGSNARAVTPLRTVVNGLQQGGHTFHFKPGAGLLSGTITFQWMRMGKVIGQISKKAIGGHHRVDRGDPPHHSAATCTIP
jgi:hypothetical protein